MFGDDEDDLMMGPRRKIVNGEGEDSAGASQ